MKTVKYHSQVGMITNSSTELFVIAKPPDNLMEILESMVRLHNMINGTDLVYSNLFRDIKVYSQEQFFNDVVLLKQRRERLLPYRTEQSLDRDLAWGYEKQKNVGKTMIYGVSDNSIPYWMFEAIESIGNIERFHLG